MEKYVQTNVVIFEKYGALLEKIDATTGEKPKGFWYPSVMGFGWTNAIVYRFVKLLKLIDQTNRKIYSTEDLSNGTPYNMSNIIH